jgi:hypothetical protein
MSGRLPATGSRLAGWGHENLSDKVAYASKDGF